MRLFLPSIKRSLPMRVLALMAWWILALPALASSHNTMASAQAMHGEITHLSVHTRGPMSVQAGCCPDRAQHDMHSPDTNCHCASSCATLFLSVAYHLPLAVPFSAEEIRLAAPDAPLAVASPPFRPPAV